MSDTTVEGDNNTVINAPVNEPCDIQDWKDRWANRRRMAWAAFLSMDLFTALLMFAVPIEKIDKLSDPLIWLYGTLTSIILGYMGTTVYAHFLNRRR